MKGFQWRVGPGFPARPSPRDGRLHRPRTARSGPPSPPSLAAIIMARSGERERSREKAEAKKAEAKKAEAQAKQPNRAASCSLTGYPVWPNPGVVAAWPWQRQTVRAQRSSLKRCTSFLPSLTPDRDCQTSSMKYAREAAAAPATEGVSRQA